MTRYTLDTNIVIALIEQRHRPLMLRLRALPGDEAGVSTIVNFELFYGAFNSQRVASGLDRLARLALPSLPFDDDDAFVAGEIRARLKQAGTPIGPYDTLIAGQALARDLTVITANVGEFARVPGLKLENWLAD